jgi:flagellin-like protein
MPKKYLNKKGVSAVVGIILMVAITVAIAATVYVYVEGKKAESGPRLVLEITPDGYPNLYGSWNIKVWKVLNATHTEGENVTVVVQVNETLYHIKTNSEGICEFVYRIPTTHKFTAFAEGYKNDYFQPEKKYIEPNSISPITTLFSPVFLFAILPILIALLAVKKGNIFMKNKYVKTIYLLINISIIILAIILAINILGQWLVDKLNNSLTSFGYPEGEILTYLHMCYWIIIALIIFLSFIILIQPIIKYIEKKREDF